ncbi:MAG: signal recognition particle receptor subunit alpha, partial [Acidimicrobiales bacterium]
MSATLIAVVVVVVLVVGLAITLASVVATRRRRHDVIEPPPRTAGPRPPRPRPVPSRPEAPRAPPPPEAPPPEVPRPEAPREAPLPEEVEPETSLSERPTFRDRLGRARALVGGRLGGIRSRSAIDEAAWEELEEVLLLADVGVATTTRLLEGLRQRVSTRELSSPADVVGALRDELVETMAAGEHHLDAGEG